MTEQPETQAPTPLPDVGVELEKLKAQNDALEQELIRKQKLESLAMISGKSVATPPVKQETFEEKWRREAKVRYAGTGLDPT